MSTPLQIALEGADSRAAIEALNESPELKLEWQENKEVTRELATTLALLATVISMTGTTIAIAEQIRKWRDLWKARTKDGKKTIDKVVLINGDRRIVLDNTTEEKIVEFLNKME